MADNTRETKKEIDIELKDVCFEFLRRWRLILLSALIFAIAFGAVQYRKDYIRANTPVVKEETKEPTLEEVYADLNKDEMERVIAAVQLNASIDAKSLYMNESVLMNINPYAENAVLVQYFVIGANAESIADSYKNYVNSGSIITDIRENYTSQLEDKYLSELITITDEKENNNNFTVKIVYTDAETAGEIADAVKGAMEQYAAKLNQNDQVHTLAVVNQTEGVIVDTKLAEVQDKYANDTLEEQSDLASIKSDMNTNQLRALIDLEKEVFPWNTTTVEQEDEQDIEDSVPQKVNVHISITQVLTGAVAGLVLAAVYIFFAYLATGKIRTKNEINNYYHARVLGEITLPEEKKKNIFYSVDKAINSLEHIGQKKLTVEEQIQMIVSNIYIAIQQDENRKICVTGSVIENISDDLLDKLREILADKNIGFMRVETITYHPEALMTAAESGKIVLIEEKRSSYYREILKEMQLCSDNNIELLGIILLEK